MIIERTERMAKEYDVTVVLREEKHKPYKFTNADYYHDGNRYIVFEKEGKATAFSCADVFTITKAPRVVNATVEAELTDDDIIRHAERIKADKKSSSLFRKTR